MSGTAVTPGAGAGIADRDDLHRRLAASEANLHTFFDTIDDFLFVLDTAGVMRQVNRTVRERLGYAEQELIGRSVLEVHPPARRDEAQRIVGEMLAGIGHYCPVPLQTKDGRLIPVETSVVHGEWNGAPALFGVSRDISQQLAAQAALEEQVRERLALLDELREREFFLRQSQEVGQLGGWRADPARNTVMWTDGVYRIVERPADYRPDLHTALDEYLPESRQRVEENLQRSLETGKPFAIRVQVRGHASGTVKWAELRGQPHLDESGRMDYMMGTLQDISAMIRTEQELERHRRHLEDLVLERTTDLVSAKLAAEAASRAKSTFLANMSHELRTPMSGIMGMLSLARRRMADPQGLDQLDKARGAAERLLDVLNDILDISKIEAERMTIVEAPIRLGSQLEHLSAMMVPKAESKGLQWRIAIDDALAREPLLGDALRLGQVLINLAGNAIKFTERGEVSVRVTAVAGDAAAQGARFEITDTGIGIDADAQGRLFSAFEQADNSMTRKYGGTGLGLAISKRLVQMMGGEIGVESTPGAGSTFWFSVRLKRRPAGAPAAGAVSPAPTSGDRLRQACGGASILLAEDEPINREVSRYMLEDAGLHVDTAEDGEQALRLSRTTRYAVILMDMQMPHLNGVEATQAIRADAANPNRGTPIVALTANAYEDDRRTCLAAGMNEFLAKPVTADDLYDTLMRALARAGISG